MVKPVILLALVLGTLASAQAATRKCPARSLATCTSHILVSMHSTELVLHQQNTAS
jgi:hypothetical protein